MTEHRDYVALEWVKGEIEETLKQAEQALEAYVEAPEDGTRMRFCLTYIHQVHGTLQMVEFYGAALLAEEMEKVAQAILNNKAREVKEAQEVLMQAILQLPGYLEHLQSGREDIPLTLLPLLNDLRSACGESLLTETSLFSPNLLPLRSEGDFQFVSAGAAEKIQRLREAYKLGLLGVIRNQGLDKSYATLAKVCMHLEQLCGEAPMARLWWIAGAVVEGMSNGSIEDSLSLKGLLRQLEKEIARLMADGDAALNTPVPEELAKNLLYYIAKSSSDSPSARSIKQVFGLTAALPESEQNQALQGSYKSAMGSVVTALSEELANLKEQFDLFTRASDYEFDKLAELGTSFKQIADTLAVLGLGPQRKALLDQIDQINHWISSQQKPEQSQLMAIASELLMVEVGLNNAAATKSRSGATSDIPVDALNTAQSAVVKECRNGLEQVKDAIIGYIASQWSPSEIEHVPELLRSVEGALAMVPQLSQAAVILNQTRSIIEERLLSETPEQPTWDMMDSLADAVAGVDYYLERVTENSQEEGGSVLQVAAESIESILGRAIDGMETDESDEFTPLDAADDDALTIDLPEDVAEEPEFTAGSIAVEETEETDAALDLDLTSDEEASTDSLTAEETSEVDLEEQQVEFELPEETPDTMDLSLESEATDTPNDDFTLDSIDLDVNDPLVSDSSVEESSVTDETTEANNADLPVLEESAEQDFSELPEDVAASLTVEEEIALESDAVLAELDSIDDGLEMDLGLASDDDLASILGEGDLDVEAQIEPVQAESTPIESSETEASSAGGSDDMIDDEIIEIFIEEAEEVQETIAEFLPAYKANYEDKDAQTEVRRAFHTLKGSGRLVGAEQVGELAWKVENMLNRVIDQTIQASPDMFALIDDVCAVLPTLVASFAKGQTADVDTQRLMDAADAIVDGKAYQGSDASAVDIPTVEETPAVETEAEEQVVAAESEAIDDFDQFAQLEQESEASADEFDLAPGDIQAQLAESLSLTDTEVTDSSDAAPDSEDEAFAAELADLDDLTLGSDDLADVAGYEEIQLDGEESSDLLEIFKGEALTHLDVLDQYIQEHLYQDSAQLTDDVQRAMHTLKGSAHMASVTAIADFSGIGERVVKEVRAAHLLADQLLLSQLNDAASWIREAVANIDENGQVELTVDPEWMESFTNAINRLPRETNQPVDDLGVVDGDASPDHQMMNIFLMEGMDILGDIELLIQQWRNEPLSSQLSNDVSAEFETLAKAARMARLTAFAAMADTLDRFVREISSLEGKPNSQFFVALDSGYEALVSLMDLLAAGQAITSTDEQIDAILSHDKATLVDPLEEVSLTEIPELDALPEVDEVEQDELSAIEGLSPLEEPAEATSVSEGQGAISLSDEEVDLSVDVDAPLADLENIESEDEFGLDALASDDDLAALVDEFDEFGGNPAEQTAEEQEPISLDVDEEDEEEDSELVSIFLEEADDIVSHLDENLQQWRGQLDNPAPIYELQRAIHTLKGGARLAEIKAIGDLCHELENLYEGLSEGRLHYSEGLLDLLQDCHDAIATQVADIHDKQEPKAYPHLEERIIAQMTNQSPTERFEQSEEITELTEEAGKALSASVPQPLSSNVDPELVEIFLEEAEELLDSITEHLEQWADEQDNLTPVAELQRELHTLKGGARMAELAPIGDLGHELENLYEGLVNGMFSSSEALIELLRTCHDRLNDMTDAVQNQQMPFAADDLIDAITQYCKSGSYDEAVLAPVAVNYAETSEEAELQDDDLTEELSDTDNQGDDVTLSEATLPEATLPEVAEEEDEVSEFAGFDEVATEETATDVSEVLEAGDELAETSEHGIELEEVELPDVEAVDDVLTEEIELEAPELDAGLLDESLLDEAQVESGAETTEPEAPVVSLDDVELTGRTLAGDELPDADIDALDDSANLEDALSELGLDIDEPDDALDVPELAEFDEAAVEGDIDLSAFGLSALDAAAMEVSDIFIEEAAELSEQLDNACHAWTQDPDDAKAKAEVLRVLHTLKGGAKLAKLEPLATAAHALESYIEDAKEPVDDVFFGDLVQRIDALGQLIEGLTSAEATDAADVNEFDALVAEALDAPEAPAELELAVEPEIDLQDDAASLEVHELSDEALLDEFAHLDDDEEAPEELILGTEIEIEKIPAPEFGPTIREALVDQNAKAGQEAVKVSADLLENLVNLAGETSITRGRLETEISDIGFTLEDMDMTVSRLRDQLKRLDIETQAQISYRTEMQQSHDYDDFDPLEMDRYTNMQQLSRALLESVTDILDLRSTLENKVRDSETLLLQQSRINTELQEGLMKTRMVPFSRLVPRLRRIVRQVAQELGKQVDFKVQNAEGEMDRTVMERMVAPLEHMLRNAVDHGVETPDVRKKAGKKPKGTIELSVSREGGDVVLRLNDDGGGVNLEAVRNKAIERNLMKPEADLSDHEVMQFIFSPGFSTAKKVTQISGRGVGMDVVNSEIKQLGGNITIDSEYGAGSQFEIRLPFTVSVNRALMVKVGDDLYAVPLNTIEGIVRVSPYELEEFYKEGSDVPYLYAGKEYRMEYMGTLLKSGHQPKLQGQVLPLPVLLVRGAEHPIALQVDSLMGSREVVVKSLGAQFSTVEGVSGATILGDGSVVIILDLAALIRAEHARYIEESSQLTEVVESAPVSDRPLKVMVVDDSVTVRKVTTRVLQRQGYEVFTAKDGVDAIAKLQDERPDIMLLDIEMPRMDGFEVASHVRHNEQIKDLPIIMITSRTGEKHRDRAMSIGVNHYMGKPFQEAALLETIELLVGKQKVSG
jgi:chemosensory pili system protein ChpA (sensor histidine kinase/response regulator)